MLGYRFNEWVDYNRGANFYDHPDFQMPMQTRYEAPTAAILQTPQVLPQSFQQQTQGELADLKQEVTSLRSALTQAQNNESRWRQYVFDYEQQKSELWNHGGL